MCLVGLFYHQLYVAMSILNPPPTARESLRSKKSSAYYCNLRARLCLKANTINGVPDKEEKLGSGERQSFTTWKVQGSLFSSGKKTELN